MELKKFEDTAGNPLTVLEYKGRWYPDFPREAICGVETFQARSDDVVICAYPKSGTHWVWEMVRFLQAGTTDLPIVEKDDGMIEFIVPADLELPISQTTNMTLWPGPLEGGPNVLEDSLKGQERGENGLVTPFDAHQLKLPSPRALNTHVHFELLPPEFFAKSCKLIYVTRDPRDVAVSYYNHHRKLVQYYQYDGKWIDYFPLFLEGKVDYESWFAYTKGWEQGIKDNPQLPIHVTSYEALHADTISELKKIATFIGCTDADENFLTKVMKKCSFDTMRATKGSIETFVDSGSPIMYRKGKVGDWKNWFTVAQSERFNTVFEQEMRGTAAYELYSHTKQNVHGPDTNMNEK